VSILITSASSAQAQKLKKQLHTGSIILGDYSELPAFMLSANMIKLPNPASNSYAHQMLALCLDKQVNTIYALKNEEMILLKEAEQLFGEYGIEIVSC
jgi:hypothetical protein